jgi:hypothetical protein
MQPCMQHMQGSALQISTAAQHMQDANLGTRTYYCMAKTSICNMSCTSMHHAMTSCTFLQPLLHCRPQVQPQLQTQPTCSSQFASATASVPLSTACGSPVKLACSARSVAVLQTTSRKSAGTLSPAASSTTSPGTSSRAGRSGIWCDTYETAHRVCRNRQHTRETAAELNRLLWIHAMCAGVWCLTCYSCRLH